MTDKEFDAWFATQTSTHILEYLGKHIRSIRFRNGIEYEISNLSDIHAAVEQELYEQMTGRE